jgi:hypothetical protein
MKLVIESDVFDERMEELKAAIARHGGTYTEVKHVPFGNVEYDVDKDAVFYGSLNLAGKMRSKCVVFNNRDSYNCTSYYPVFAHHLLNNNYAMLPFGDLKRRWPWVIDTFGAGEHRCVFIRPDSGEKIFTGMVMCRNTLDIDIEFIERYVSVPHNTLVVVAPAKKVEKEFRFVIHNGKPITGSLYRVGSDVVHETVAAGHPVFEKAREVLHEVNYEPESLWTLDLCESGGEIRVLEIGCFSCAGFYACDFDLIVQAVKEETDEKEV